MFIYLFLERGLMYTEKLKESIGGVTGSFILQNWEVVESDMTCELQFITQSIVYLMEAISDRRTLRQFVIFGEKANFSVSFRGDKVAGVLLDPTANIQLLNLVLKRVLDIPEPEEIKHEVWPGLEEKIPYLERPREDVLPNVPQYARQVLEYVDGTRTIREIMEQSGLPPEVVLDVILSYRRTSIIHYKG